jgi:acyl-CoA synthetase (AMP-forming)/AMP-acid ligase II
VILANRSRGKADDLAAAMGGNTSVASLEDVAAGVHEVDKAAASTLRAVSTLPASLERQLQP